MLACEIIDEFVYIDIPDQHEDTYRFIEDAEKLLNRKIKTIKDGRSVEEVCLQYAFINSPFGAKCTSVLKKNVRKKFEKEIGETRNVWGFTIEEIKRRDRLLVTNPDDIFPLIDKKLKKADCHYLIAEKGIKQPEMYSKYKNNNCIGCIKGGKGYWNQIRKDFPNVFERRAKMERKIGASIINGIYLDELPETAGKNEPITAECGIYCQLERS